MEAVHKQSDGWSDGEIRSSDMHKVLQMDVGSGKGREENGTKRGKNKKSKTEF